MIHLIVGNTGAGKTTYANELKSRNGGIIFSIDMWNNTLFLPDKKDTDRLGWFLERIDRVELVIMNLVKQLESSKVDSILDLGLSKYEHREKFRIFAIGNNFEHHLHYLNIDKEIRWDRIQQRNLEKGDTYQFNVSKEDFDFMETWFQPPTKEELKHAVIVFE